MPGLGDKYEMEIETVSKPKAEFHTDEYYALDLPVAPAVMAGEEIVVEGSVTRTRSGSRTPFAASA